MNTMTAQNTVTRMQRDLELCVEGHNPTLKTKSKFNKVKQDIERLRSSLDELNDLIEFEIHGNNG